MNSTPWERLQPCLLTRLTDNEPGNPYESASMRSVPMQVYRESVMRDLRWLLNTSSNLPGSDLEGFPEVSKSILNYGMRSLCGRSLSGIRFSELERDIKKSIIQNECRIEPETLEVRVRSSRNRRQASDAIVIEIAGELWAEPANEHIRIKTEVDLESGEWRL